MNSKTKNERMNKTAKNKAKFKSPHVPMRKLLTKSN